MYFCCCKALAFFNIKPILLGGYQYQLGPTVYLGREYCVRYDESDLYFVQRRCAEEGIHYNFEHSPQGHVLGRWTQ
ncbi:contractile injection system protein, VgrG/Pvc8 family [Stutzerimonas chloritidismutans]|uniref:Contractile injection system protein, VgrG/Pvc8 family n=1 Tax=Stutzerimonas chloritidismutans TaxID=203192 RepID=A0ABU9MEE5_STUCH